MTSDSLSHVDGSGRLQMVDVSAKSPTRRVARASCVIVTALALDELRSASTAPDVVQSARLSGIQGAKASSSLIPLCHPLVLDDVQVDVTAHARGLEVTSSVTTVSRTGVEMEALTACVLCALSLIDSIGELAPGARMADLALLSKSGGKSDWGRELA